MKKLVSAIALVTAMAAPAFANSPKYYDMAPSDAGVRASVQLVSGHARGYEGSEYVGQDPDSRIQSELRRDTPSDRGV